MITCLNLFGDPTRIFSILCLSIMTVRFSAANDWDVLATLQGFYCNPYVLLFLSSAIIIIYASKPRNTLELSDRWAAEWYWWNAWLFHATMDGAAGSLRLVPMVVHQYDMLDLRFINHHVVPWLVGLIELLCMYPLCLACVYCIRTQHPLRFPLELITSTLHIMGMVLFVVAEVYEGQQNIPALDPVGDSSGSLTLKFNIYHITYYWFGFWFCNLIWGWVPLIRIHHALRECRSAIALQEGKRA